jgi:hypothetical protein
LTGAVEAAEPEPGSAAFLFVRIDRIDSSNRITTAQMTKNRLHATKKPR